MQEIDYTEPNREKYMSKNPWYSCFISISKLLVVKYFTCLSGQVNINEVI